MTMSFNISCSSSPVRHIVALEKDDSYCATISRFGKNVAGTAGISCFTVPLRKASGWMVAVDHRIDAPPIASCAVNARVSFTSPDSKPHPRISIDTFPNADTLLCSPAEYLRTLKEPTPTLANMVELLPGKTCRSRLKGCRCIKAREKRSKRSASPTCPRVESDTDALTVTSVPLVNPLHVLSSAPRIGIHKARSNTIACRCA
mmetsp:Transcript_425/g.656  ORF Transcript_425/g.656 Transcript_425/m.656 type:complete len:203 (-) Transcript_425:105-713(-)